MQTPTLENPQALKSENLKNPEQNILLRVFGFCKNRMSSQCSIKVRDPTAVNNDEAIVFVYPVGLLETENEDSPCSTVGLPRIEREDIQTKNKVPYLLSWTEKYRSIQPLFCQGDKNEINVIPNQSCISLLHCKAAFASHMPCALPDWILSTVAEEQAEPHHLDY